MSLAEAAIQSAIEAIEEPRTARMDQLTKPYVKASIEIAADLMGIEASAFVVMSAYARAQELLSRPCFVEGDHQALLSALDEASTPTPALLEAWQLHQNQAAWRSIWISGATRRPVPQRWCRRSRKWWIRAVVMWC